jgi:hypothetical protein
VLSLIDQSPRVDAPTFALEGESFVQFAQRRQDQRLLIVALNQQLAVSVRRSDQFLVDHEIPRAVRKICSDFLGSRLGSQSGSMPRELNLRPHWF